MTPRSPLPPLVSALDARLGLPEGELGAEDRTRAESALEEASTLIFAEVSLAATSLGLRATPAVITLVALKAARREFDNPRGLNQETVGEHAVGLTETSGVYLAAQLVIHVQSSTQPKGSTVITELAPNVTPIVPADMFQRSGVKGFVEAQPLRSRLRYTRRPCSRPRYGNHRTRLRGRRQP